MAKLADIDDSEDEKESKNDDKDEDYKPSVEDDVQDADESGPSTSATSKLNVHMKKYRIFQDLT
jgi:hypothetical protein